MADTAEVSLLVAFSDFTRFAAQAERVESADLARALGEYYELVGARIDAAGGQVVKFIGDAALMVFPPAAVDSGVAALLDLKDAADLFMAERDWDCRLLVKAHFGPVVAGPFGVQGDKRYDVIGRMVNVAARLDTTGVALSAEAFRQLSPALRQCFKKRTPPVTYIRQEDSHRQPRVLRQ